MPEEVVAASEERVNWAWDQALSYLDVTKHNGNPSVYYWKGSFWVWTADRPCYRRFPPREMIYVLMKWLADSGEAVSYRAAEAVMHAVIPNAVAPEHLDHMPCWIKGALNRHKKWIALKNWLVDPVALAQGRREVQGHTPQWFSSLLLPYEYQPQARCPRWEGWLEEMLDGDAQRIALLQEMFGYWLTPDTSRQVALLLVGPERTGKSTVCEVAKQIVGLENTSYVGISDFGDRFSLATTHGKALNISDEIGDLSRQAEAKLKWFIGGQEMSLEDKGVTRYTAKPTARLLVSVNEWPKIRDTTGAVYRRLKVLPMTHQVPEAEMDTALWDAFRNELPGIFNWSLIGLRRLMSQNGFTKSEVGDAELASIRSTNQSWTQFMDDCVTASPKSFVTSDVLMSAFQSWCRRNAVKTTVDIRTLKDQILKRFTAAKSVRRQVDRVQARGIEGISLR